MKRNAGIAAAAVLVAASFALKELMGYSALTVVVMLASTAVSGYPVFRKALGALRYRIVGIEALVTVAVTGALVIGEYWEAAAVTFLFNFGAYLEGRTLEKTRSSIKALLSRAPDTARVLRNGAELIVSPGEVLPGETVVVKPGERIAVDGTVLEGSAYVNQSTVTGESVPVGRSAGDTVYAGTVAESGYLVLRADRVGEETTFARIIRLVEEAQDSKAKTQKFLERFSRYYTPFVIVLAAAMYLITRDLRLSLTLLVIACPGALVISAPVSIVAGIGNGAAQGILVKGGDVMERLGTVKAVAFDKTGTVTRGESAVVGLDAFDGDGDRLLRIAAAGEAYSEHPAAKAILRHAAATLPDSSIPVPEESELIPGRGVAFTFGGVRYLLGNRALFSAHGVSVEAHEDRIRTEEDAARTVVLLGTAEGLLGTISVADSVREDAAALIASLKKLGIKRIAMLTGDNERTAAAIAGELGFDEYSAALLPEGKVAALADLRRRYGTVAMVGDGVNDAPALASADLGIAVGGAGADVAMETADVVVISDRLAKLSHAVGLSRATVRNMGQNIAFALAVAGLLLAGVLVRTVDLSFGMLVHELSVLLVIVNAVRLLRFKTRI